MKKPSLILRFLTLQSLMLWQGGFLFYALVVVPTGGQVLGSETLQGFITRQVTTWLNFIGIFSLLSMILDSIHHSPHRRVRIILSIASLLILTVLIMLHLYLESLLRIEARSILNPQQFYFWHAVYLCLSGIQWMLSLAAAWLMLRAWRASDAPVP